LKWFKHQSKAYRDTKIKKLINDFGAEGYAIYFYCLELIADNLDSENITFELEDDAFLIGQYLKIDTLKVESIMKKCIELDLFGLSASGKINCIKMAKFLDDRYTRNPELKKMIKSDKMQDVKNRLSEDKLKTKRDMSYQIRLDYLRLDKNILDNKDIFYQCNYFNITNDKHKELQDIFPTVNILTELKKCKLWLDDNPLKANKMTRWNTFISNWLKNSLKYDKQENNKHSQSISNPYDTPEIKEALEAYEKAEKEDFDRRVALHKKEDAEKSHE
jgi:hypothetical protein